MAKNKQQNAANSSNVYGVENPQNCGKNKIGRAHV